MDMSDSYFRGRNLLVLLFEIILVVVAIGGLTFATSKLMGSSTIITFGEYNVDYVGKTEVEVSNLEPISDSLVSYDSSDNVIRVEFSLRGVLEDNKEDLIYDVMLSDINIDCSLLNEYTKWNLYKNEKLLYKGNFSPKFDGNVLTDNMKLTEIQQDLPKYNEGYDNYVLIIWISESCDDLTNCLIVNQSDIVNSIMDMKIFIALSSGEKVLYERVPKNDATCVNKPILYDKMIPVYYSDGAWKIANKSNSDINNLWYDYEKSIWANSVVVNTDKYDNSIVGTVISNDDVLGYYVWIPRFKYKLWNNGSDITDSYDAYSKGIDIVFESGVNSSGEVKCISGKCIGNSDKYLTHPAFANNLRGFWISKYEISEDNRFIPNVVAMKNASLDEYTGIINNLASVYGIDNINSHIINNLEWGATSYLSHSKYGLCIDNECKSIGMNKSYISEANKQDTTTGNVYGVYDMSGASSEYVVGDISLGSALSEVRTSENETWYNGLYVLSDREYALRGGVDRGLFYNSDIGMFDVSTRSVLVDK